MPTLRIPLSDQVETRDGTSTKDSTMVNCFVELIEKKPYTKKRFGTSLKTTLAVGTGQALFDLQNIDFAVINDKLYNENNVNTTYTAPTAPNNGRKYQSVNSPDGLKTMFKTDYGGYSFNGSNVTKISTVGGITSITIKTSGSGGAIGTYPLVITSVAGVGSGATGTYTVGGTTTGSGITWTQRSLNATDNWIGIAWNGTRYCAIAYNSRTTATSADGISWVANVNSMPVSTYWVAIASNGTIFCAIASGSAAATSTNGVSWIAQTLPRFITWASIIWTGTQFIAAGRYTVGVYPGQRSDYYLVTATSPDGVTWTQTADFYSGLTFIGNEASGPFLAWNGTVFCLTFSVVSGSNNGQIYTATSSAVSWTQQTVPVQTLFSGVSWNGTNFCSNFIFHIRWNIFAKWYNMDCNVTSSSIPLESNSMERNCVLCRSR